MDDTYIDSYFLLASYCYKKKSDTVYLRSRLSVGRLSIIFRGMIYNLHTYIGTYVYKDYKNNYKIKHISVILHECLNKNKNML